MAERIFEYREIAISVSLADALVLDSLLRRYENSDPQALNPNASEYAALMNLAGALERMLETDLGLEPERYTLALAEAYQDLGDPAGYRGDAPPGPPSV